MLLALARFYIITYAIIIYAYNMEIAYPIFRDNIITLFETKIIILLQKITIANFGKKSYN